MLNIENGFGAIALDQQQQLDREQGYAVLPTTSGLGTECEVTVNSGTLGNSDTIQVNSGDILVDGSVVSVSQQNAQIDVSNIEPRKDVIYLDATGTVQVKKGVPANANPSGNVRFQTYSPTPYDMHDIDGVVVAVVWVPADSTSITSSDLRDRRLPANKAVNQLNAQTVNAGDLDIGGSDLVSSGEFVPIGPTFEWATKTFSTTSTSYDSSLDQFLARVRWDDWLPSGAQAAVNSVMRLQGTNGDVRVVNAVEGDTIHETLDVNTNAWVNMGPTTYTPGLTGDDIEIKCEIRTNDGSASTDLLWPRVQLGIQL